MRFHIGINSASYTTRAFTRITRTITDTVFSIANSFFFKIAVQSFFRNMDRTCSFYLLILRATISILIIPKNAMFTFTFCTEVLKI